MTILGLFDDSKAAGNAVAELKEKGFTKEISVLARDAGEDEGDASRVKDDVTAGTAAGAAVGAVTGALAAVFAGLTSFAVPGLGLVAAGPLAAALGLSATGAVTGGLVGALADYGINEPEAKMYDEKIRAGGVLVGISAADDRVNDVRGILDAHGATEVSTLNK